MEKIPKDSEKVQSSLKIAKAKLEEAKNLFNSDFLSNSLLSAYTSMFHCARAVLYNEGVQEKSHYGVYAYLREKFSNKIPLELLNSFNSLRGDRHEVLYGFQEYVSKKKVERAILDCEEFLGIIEEMLI